MFPRNEEERKPKMKMMQKNKMMREVTCPPTERHFEKVLMKFTTDSAIMEFDG